MITPTLVFWVMWLVLLFVGMWIYPPNQEPNYRPFGLHFYLWIMLGLLGVMAKGSPFAGW
jgi:hypothetical protein